MTKTTEAGLCQLPLAVILTQVRSASRQTRSVLRALAGAWRPRGGFLFWGVMMTAEQGNERQQWARKNQGWAFTGELVSESAKFDWDGDWPEVDTDGYLTGECVEPGGSEEYTVVDVIEPPVGPAYVHEGSGASMAVVRTADLQARQVIETAAPVPGGGVDSVTVEQGNNSDWLVRVHLRSHDAAKLVAFLERMKGADE